MKSACLIAASVLFLISCSQRVHYTPEVNSVLKELDAAVEDKTAAETAKNLRISQIRSGLDTTETPAARYEIMDRLYAEYYQYDIDSAVYYASHKLELARAMNDEEYILDATFDLADRYTLSGMYPEALSLMEPLDINRLSYMRQPAWCHVYKNIYTGLEAGCDDARLKKDYGAKKEKYRQMLYDRLGDDDISRIYVETEMKLDAHKGEEVVRDLTTVLADDSRTVHEKAVLHYIMAQACIQSGDEENAILYLAKSAIHDLETPVNEYRALYELASILYENGDVRRAYRYINRSVNDALTANARLNIQAINTLLPLIAKANNDAVRKNQTIMALSLTGISILAIALIIAGALTMRSKKKLAAANFRLNELIRLLKESNSLKENYIGQYLDMCSYYIGGLERYRSRLRKAAKEGGLAEVSQSLKSTDFIDKELVDFYKQFDTTFLKIFPDFVEQLNVLLRPEERIENKSKSGLLSTELRVAALIRLGVTDSDKIAYFLRRSVSTIYNYRVKLRNAALSDREDFENQIMRIGMI